MLSCESGPQTRLRHVHRRSALSGDTDFTFSASFANVEHDAMRIADVAAREGSILFLDRAASRQQPAFCGVNIGHEEFEDRSVRLAIFDVQEEAPASKPMSASLRCATGRLSTVSWNAVASAHASVRMMTSRVDRNALVTLLS